VLIHVPTSNVIVAYDTRAEAEDALAWYRETFFCDRVEIEVRNV
jgi:hypothetical protein